MSKAVFFILLLSTSLFSQTSIPKSIIDKIESGKLAQTKQWQRLMHYRNGSSEIDDPKFFFSSSGKTNLKNELIATVKKLIIDKSDDENSTLCRYPSRSNWLLKKLPKLKQIIKIPKCTKLKKEINSLEAKQVTLVFASAHMNSPASAFGHTFLRIDSDKDMPLLSYAVNYSAQTREDNGFIYAYQGLFGGYKGLYSIEPYTKKLKTYSDLEQRDIWEYPLNLNQEEINKMLLHIFEIKNFYADYFFLAENCSYNLLWLLEVAKDNIELTNRFNFKAIPIDTIRAIVDNNLVKETKYRPSKQKKMLELSEEIEDIPNAIAFTKSNNYNFADIENLNRTQKAKALELATHRLQIRYGDNEIDKKTYLKLFLHLLKERSRYGKIRHKPIQTPISPREGHSSTKATFSYAKEGEFSARIKVSYHDIYDNESGYISGAYINFFDTSLGYKDNKFTINELNFLDIRSYAIQNAIFKPISWQVAVGGKRIFNNEINAYLKAGAGLSLGSDKLFTYATLTPTLYYRDNGKQSISANLGLIYNQSTSFKFGLLGTREWFKDNQEIEEIEPFVTYSISKDSAINIKYISKNIDGLEEEDITLSWFWYF
ncbi:putative outermembrane protein [hydrothermal vent metagenome]|uniref:Putative outermembrane protein n=1 Tax=hydrothermal vent metagenome TaxID=652676 RepID=A0A1W1C8Z8_9ZZZZ